MALDWPVRAVAGQQDFWEEYFWLPGREARRSNLELSALGTEFEHPIYPGLINDVDRRRCQLDFPVGLHRGLRLEFDDFLTRFSLLLVNAAGMAREIGWDGQHSYYPDVLRWEELDLIGKCVMIADPTLPHPGLTVLLLLRFTPIGDDDNAAGRIFPMIHDAWRAAGLPSMADREGELTGLADAQGSGFEWIHDEEGWKLDQRDSRRGTELRSTRHVENRDFPHDTFNALIDDARRLAATLLDRRWVDANIHSLARAIDADKDFDRLPILADALMDAGCDNELTLVHCRNPLPGQESSWVVNDILDKSWRRA